MNTILIGAQWGDEGKGKIIDVLTEKHDVIVRTQGGNNAGHTVEVGKEKFVLHLIPSGILWKGKICVVGNGVVVDPVALLKEMDSLKEKKISLHGRLFISETAHLVFPYHCLLDEGRENQKGKIGTTKRGIGPTYADKAYRVGIRVGDLLKPKAFEEKLKARVRHYNSIAKAQKWKTVSEKKLLEEYLESGKKLRPYITHTVLLLHDLMKEKHSMLFEGAQGTFLDIDHGTYPFVTSSNTTAGGACTGSGMPPSKIDHVVGVMKAYTTRVGEGPLPTQDDEISDLLHGLGREFGATTGRPRRCGWFDAVITRYAQKVNGIDHLAVTNLDGLDTVKKIKVCVAYKLRGKQIDSPPSDVEELAQCKPVYRVFEGWQTSTSKIRSFKKLPSQAQTYLKALSNFTGAKLKIISVGAHRKETFFYG